MYNNVNKVQIVNQEMELMEKITTIITKNTGTKIPQSPYSDNTFVFETHTSSSNYEMFSVMASHFILNTPLVKLNKPTRTFRRKLNLQQYYDKNITYIILDINKVKSEFNKQQILDYFRVMMY